MKPIKLLTQPAFSALLIAGTVGASQVLSSSQAVAEPKGTLKFGAALQSRHWNTFRQIGDTFPALIFENLVNYSPDGKSVVPRLATSWTQTKNKVTFKLQKGAIFHDGTPFNAAAVITNFKRMQKSRGQYSVMLLPVSSMSAPDGHTVVLDLNRPAPTLLRNLAMRGAVMVSPKTIEDKSANKNPVGTGPWQLVKAESKHGSKIVVEKFDKYYAPEKVGVARIEVYSIPDPNTLLNALTTGKLDVINVNGQLAPVAKSQGFEIRTKPVLIQHMLMLDRKKVFADENVRKAVCHAIDTKVWVDVALNGFGKPQQSRFGKGLPGHYADIQGYSHDLKKAKEYMKKAGNPDISFTFPAHSRMKALAQLLKSQLAKINIKVNVAQMTPRQYFSKYQSNTYPLQINTSASENTGVYDYQKFRFGPKGTGNPFRAEVPELDALTEAALKETDPKKQDAGWQKVMKYINDHALDCGFYQMNSVWAYNPKVISNFETTVMKPTALRYREIRLK